MFPHWVFPDVWLVLDKCWFGVSPVLGPKTSLQLPALSSVLLTLPPPGLCVHSITEFFTPHPLSVTSPLAQPILEATRFLVVVVVGCQDFHFLENQIVLLYQSV